MVSIATLASLFGTIQKFLGIAAKEGLPDEFYQKVIDDPDFRSEFVAWAQGRLNPGVAATVSTDANRFELSVEVQIAALRRANDEEGWGIPVEDINRLTETAPAWPKGRLAFRSFRIRFGEGDEGVAKTFEAHAKLVNAVFGGKFWRWDYLLSAKDRLRLLVGNHTHKPTVEWVVIDLDAHRKRNSITAVRGPKSLADELFVFTWLFPDYIRSINYEENPGIFAGGYELNVPEYDGEPWQRVPCVSWDRDRARVELDAGWRSDVNSVYSVPVLRE